MNIITVDNLQKQFKVRRHHRGRWANMKNLVTRDYQTIDAVDQVSFQVKAGELVGYLGPNGAGKSTTIKMLTGLLVPTDGEIEVNGYVPWRDRQTYVARIGAVFGQRTTLWWDLPVIESLELLQFMYRVPPTQFRQTLDDFNDLLELSPFLNSPVRSLSLGQRMRADICAALLHRPDLLFLDEPTIGLDVVAKERIRHFIRHVNQEWGTTILLTTHDLADVQKLCDRVIIIDQGRLLYNGELIGLQERFGGKRELVVDFAEKYTVVDVDGAEIAEQQNGRVTYQFDQKKMTASELIGRISARYRIQDLAVREPDIEATIRRIYEERLLA
ncbi:MAG: ATP-binding cassette domain-containing protein [Chloroflexota bacterium]